MTQAVYPGFILSRQQNNHKGQLQLCYWVKTDRGVCKVTVMGEHTLFFIRARDITAASNLLQENKLPVDIRQVCLQHFDSESMYACYFTSSHQLFLAKQLLKTTMPLYEDDIRHCDRFLMERFIKGSVWVKGITTQKSGYIEVSNAQFKANEYYVPKLSVLSLDIECSGDGVLFSVGLVTETTQWVVMIGQPQEGPDYIEWVEDEVALLVSLMAKVKALDPDIIIGWNIIEFDCVVLAERALALGIELILGRDEQSIHIYKGNYVRVLISGRVVIDGIDTLKNATYHFDSFRLSEVSKQVLGQSKLIDQGDRLEEIVRQFNEDKQSLAEYNLQDCRLVLDIFDKLKLLDFALARTRLTGLELERMGGSVAAFTNLYLPLLHRSGYVAPNLGEHGLSFDSPGGYVMESTPGLFNNVIVLDFKSLYPSIIRTFLVDPLGLIKGLTDSGNSITGFNGGVFSRTEHHLPGLVEDLLFSRQTAKSANDPMLSQAIKIIMNSFYGVLGSTGCRFYDPRLASSITLRGHEIMQQTKSWIEEQGYDVIYGDTDSTFVCLPPDWNASRCNEAGKRLTNLINNAWQVYCRAHFDLESHLEIEFETYYSPFFLPTLRGEQKGSKKRYVGQIEKEGKQELIYKGMETVRSDWTKIAQQYQQDLFTAFFQNQDLLQITEHCVERIKSGKVDSLLLYSKRLGREIEMYTKNIPPHVKAARKHMMKNPSIKYRKGQKVNYVVTVEGPRVDCLGCEIDYDHYINKQIYPILRMLPQCDDVFFKLTVQGGFSF
ncbi:DNA polymerase II [Pseudoalteromonas sp. MSK9-3]|uniref:DNA polymerase II n=1 Tax=Pseudoalteromonas sp. MSK9-3 TaxID=1897633 RepID=UPI000E6BEAB2|nr:DNA polymerase II [Pseudoalteromonas sp. MSK9-3]RJE75606.1 DNA polymerase II [Pseudoalteromonas sp. MSK9-3]